MQRVLVPNGEGTEEMEAKESLASLRELEENTRSGFKLSTRE